MDELFDIVSEAEDAIIAHLRQKLPEYRVESTPSDPDAFSAKGGGHCILVRYNGGKDTAPPVDGPPERRVPTRRTLDYVLLIGARSLRADGFTAAYEIMARTRRAMRGFRITVPRNERPVAFYANGDQFIREENGIWWYGLRIKSTEFFDP